MFRFRKTKSRSFWRSISSQIQILEKLFPSTAGGYVNYTIDERALPKKAEVLLAAPRWEIIAPTYGEAVQIVLD
jgi:hypothetical protein